MEEIDIERIPTDRIAENSKVKVVILPDKEGLYRHFASEMFEELKRNNERNKPTRWILPVGPTPQYDLLAEMIIEEDEPVKNLHTFNMDEYLDWTGRPVPRSHPMSFQRFMWKHLFGPLQRASRRKGSRIKFQKSQVHFPDPSRLDEISKQIRKVGGIDTCFGGIGYHGHIAFNEPPDTYFTRITPEMFRNSPTRIVLLRADTYVVNSICGSGGNPEMIPPMAVTLGMKDILSSRKIRLYCDGGPWQSYSFRYACLGKITMERPVTFVQEHPDVVIYADEETAAPIKVGPK